MTNNYFLMFEIMTLARSYSFGFWVRSCLRMDECQRFPVCRLIHTCDEEREEIYVLLMRILLYFLSHLWLVCYNYVEKSAWQLI